jgi:hypothetical protein
MGHLTPDEPGELGELGELRLPGNLGALIQEHLVETVLDLPLRSELQRPVEFNSDPEAQSFTIE